MLLNKILLSSLIFNLVILMPSSFSNPLKGETACKNETGCLSNSHFKKPNHIKIIEDLKAELKQCLINDNKLCIQEKLFDLGEIYSQISDYDLSISYYQESIKFVQPDNSESERTRAIAWVNIGYVKLLKGEYKKSIEYSEKALEYAQNKQDRTTESFALMNLGSAYNRICQYQHSREKLERSKKIAEYIAQKIDYRKPLADVYSNLGNLERTLGYPILARDHHQKAVDIAEDILKHKPNAINVKKSKANALGNLGLAYYTLANYKKAEESHEKRLKLAKQIHDTKGIVKAKSDLGSVYYRYGDFKKAIEYHKEYLTWAEQNNDLEGQIYSRLNLASDYNALGQPEESSKLIEEANTLIKENLNIDEKNKDCQVEANALNVLGLAKKDLGIIYQNSEFYQEAEKHFQESINISQKYNNEWNLSHATGNLGSTYLIWGKQDNRPELYQKAIENYKIKLDILEKYKNNDLRSRGAVLTNIGIAQTYLEDYKEASKNLEEARLILSKIGDLNSHANSLAATGFLFEKQGEIDSAIDKYNEAIIIKESIRSNLQIRSFNMNPEDQQSNTYTMSFEDQQINIYNNLVELLWDKGNYSEAFRVLEQAKAKTLFDQLATNKIEFGRNIDNDLLQREKDLQFEINARREELTSLKDLLGQERDRINSLDNKLKLLKQEYDNVIEQISLQDPETAYLLKPDAEKRLSLEEIQEKLDPQTILLEYFITDNRTFAFIIRHKNQPKNFLPVELKDAQNNSLSRQKFNEINIRIRIPDTPQDSPPQRLQTLHKLLISPLEKQGYLKTSKLIIVPHGRLHAIPFAALYDGNDYLLDKFTSLSVLPNANLLKFIKPKTTPINQILILGKPSVKDLELSSEEKKNLEDLEFVKEETRRIANLYGQKATLKFKQEATETLMYQQSQDADIIHIAAHGKYEPNNPLQSTLYLARDHSKNDGKLTVREIYSLDLTKRTKLVILSACETNIGEITKGDEIIGLNRAFIYAGTPSIIGTLWKVEDEATAELMTEFHKNMLKKGMNKGEALIEAQKTVRQDYPHPFYWAAFTLTGDGGKL